MVLKYTVPKGKEVKIKAGGYVFKEGQVINTADFKLPDFFTDGTRLTIEEETSAPEQPDTNDESPQVDPSEEAGQSSTRDDSSGNSGSDPIPKRARKGRRA